MRSYLLPFLFLLLGCSQKVIQFVNDDSNFGNYRTYLLVNFRAENAEPTKEGQELINNIELQVQEQLKRRNYEPASTQPDIILRYEFVSNNNSRTNVNSNPYDPFVTVNTRTFRESILLFEMTDRKTKKLIWQASLDLKQQHRASKKEDELKNAIVAIFNTYPYRALQSKPDPSIIN